jgi:predicted amidohydrolase
MRAALVIERVRATPAENTSLMVEACDHARGCDLVLFPEAALTGLVNNDDPAHDLPLGQTVPGPATDAIGHAARRNGQYVAFGLLEREGDGLYDAAVLLAPSGEIALHYRRIQPQWHGRGADPSVYCQGSAFPVAETALGRVAFVICGDLFDDGIVGHWRSESLDLALVPLSRSFSDGSFDQARWDAEEEAEYAARVAALGCTALLANQLEDPTLTPWPAFGGAMVVARDGTIGARWPLATAGTLVTEA